MYKLNPSSKKHFLDRFQSGYDGIIREILHFYGFANKEAQTNIIVGVQEIEQGWVNLRLSIIGVKRFIFQEGPGCYQVLSQGISFDWFGSKLYLSFDLDPDENHTKDDYEASQFLIVGDTCFWEIFPYEEYPIAERFTELNIREDVQTETLPKIQNSYIAGIMRKDFKTGMIVKFGELEDGDKFKDETGAILSKFPSSVLPADITTNAVNLLNPDRCYFFKSDQEVEFVEHTSGPFPYYVFDTIR